MTECLDTNGSNVGDTDPDAGSLIPIKIIADKVNLLYATVMAMEKKSNTDSAEEFTADNLNSSTADDSSNAGDIGTLYNDSSLSELYPCKEAVTESSDDEDVTESDDDESLIFDSVGDPRFDPEVLADLHAGIFKHDDGTVVSLQDFEALCEQ